MGIATDDTEFIEEINSHLIHLVADMVAPPEASRAMRDALRIGLRASWVQSLAQALAVALGEAELDELAENSPVMFEKTVIGSLKGPDVTRYAKRLRERTLIPGEMVTVPLAEFSAWRGPLIGPGSFAAFTEWAALLSSLGRGQTRGADRRSLARNRRGLVHLHEICIAQHLRIRSPESECSWSEDAFALLRVQPLVQPSQVDELAAAAASCLAPGERTAASVEDTPPLRFALPSLPIDNCAA